jgi:hypothetical protein
VTTIVQRACARLLAEVETADLPMRQVCGQREGALSIIVPESESVLCYPW